MDLIALRRPTGMLGLARQCRHLCKSNAPGSPKWAWKDMRLWWFVACCPERFRRASAKQAEAIWRKRTRPGGVMWRYAKGSKGEVQELGGDVVTAHRRKETEMNYGPCRACCVRDV